MAKRKPNHSGRNSESVGRFVRLGHDLLASDAYRSLRPLARALLVELVMLDTGKSNGGLFMSETDAVARLGISDKKAARRAFVDLAESGLISMTKDSFFSVKAGQGRARCWRLTWLFDHASRKPATNDWKAAALSNAGARKRAESGQRALKRYMKKQNAGEENTPTTNRRASVGAVAGEENTPVKLATRANLPKVKREENTPHIAVTMGRHGRWWGSEPIARAYLWARVVAEGCALSGPALRAA